MSSHSSSAVSPSTSASAHVAPGSGASEAPTHVWRNADGEPEAVGWQRGENARAPERYHVSFPRSGGLRLYILYLTMFVGVLCGAAALLSDVIR